MLEQLKQERNNLILILLLIVTYSFNSLISDENIINLSGHSHNDYYQSRPLFDALDNYMKSIEIDVFYIDEKFYVAYSKDEIIKTNTLDLLYLEQLIKIINNNNGYIYPNQTSIFYIFIDIKENGKTAIPILYKQILAFQKKIKEIDKFKFLVKFVITGDNDYESIKNTNGVLSIDGRPIDLTQDLKYDNNLMPIISDDIKNWTKAKVPNEATIFEKNKLEEFINKAHSKGKLIRFWGYEDSSEIWNFLNNLGVDLINNDKPKTFNHFINNFK